MSLKLCCVVFDLLVVECVQVTLRKKLWSLFDYLSSINSVSSEADDSRFIGTLASLVEYCFKGSVPPRALVEKIAQELVNHQVDPSLAKAFTLAIYRERIFLSEPEASHAMEVSSELHVCAILLQYEPEHFNTTTATLLAMSPGAGRAELMRAALNSFRQDRNLLEACQRELPAYVEHVDWVYTLLVNTKD